MNPADSPKADQTTVDELIRTASAHVKSCIDLGANTAKLAVSECHQSALAMFTVGGSGALLLISISLTWLLLLALIGALLQDAGISPVSTLITLTLLQVFASLVLFFTFSSALKKVGFKHTRKALSDMRKPNHSTAAKPNLDPGKI